MDFSLTETQVLLRDMAERVVREVYGFGAKRKVIETAAKASNFDVPGFWETVADLGLLGAGIDEEFGGSGGNFFDRAIVLDAFGRGLVTEPIIASAICCADLVLAAGSLSQSTTIVPKLVDGSRKFAFAHAEMAGFACADAVKATARISDDGYRLSGTKLFVSGGDRADTFLVSARTDEGVALFLVPADAPGLARHAYPTIDGSGAVDLSFEDLPVPEHARLNSDQDASAAIDWALDRTIVAHCCSAVGTIQALNELTLDYIKTRTQFDRTIGSFQAIQHRMVDMAIAAEIARSSLIFATAQVDSADPKGRAMAAAGAKAKIGEAARIVGQGSIQLHGGIGLTDEAAVSHFFKRLTAFELTHGTTGEHLARFAAM